MMKDGENRISVEFRDGVCEKWPVFNRKYTVTHSDETAEIFVTIGMEYARDKYSAMRDEVILHFLCCNNCIKMMGYVQIDVPGRYFDREKRKTIFCREMPKALQAVRYADRIFLMPMRNWIRQRYGFSLCRKISPTVRPIALEK